PPGCRCAGVAGCPDGGVPAQPGTRGSVHPAPVVPAPLRPRADRVPVPVGIPHELRADPRRRGLLRPARPERAVVCPQPGTLVLAALPALVRPGGAERLAVAGGPVLRGRGRAGPGVEPAGTSRPPGRPAAAR